MEDPQSAYSLNIVADNYYRHQDEDSLRQVIESVAGLIRYFARLYGGDVPKMIFFRQEIWDC